jgi:hypothetical protein
MPSHAQVLGIEPRRQLGRADEVAEHYRELTAFGLRRQRRIRMIDVAAGRQGGDRVEQPLAMAEGGHAELPQIAIVEAGEHIGVNIVVGEGRRILT